MRGKSLLNFKIKKIQTRRTRMSKQGVFKLCNTVALVLSLSLTICAVFSIWSFTKYDANDRDVVHNQLVPAYQYFDTNRDAQAILNIRPHVMPAARRGSIGGETQPCKFVTANDVQWTAKFGTVAATAWA